jgi:hypothetical protein
MKHDDLKKVLNYSYQLSTFALTIADEMKDHREWVEVANKLLAYSKEMNQITEKNLKV